MAKPSDQLDWQSMDVFDSVVLPEHTAHDGLRLRYGSVCSGIEAVTVAWRPLGFVPAWFAEIDSFCSALLAYRYPGVKNLGDFTQIDANHGPIDVLVGGTPCQSFSVAGRRKGLDDPRGDLAIQFCHLAGKLRPRWIVWENVAGVLSSNKGRDFAAILGALAQFGYGCAWRVLDAQYFGVPQRRRRVYVVGYLGDWRRAVAVLFECESLRGHTAARRKAPPPTSGAAEVGPCNSRYADGAPTSGTRHKGSPSQDRISLIAFGGGNASGPIGVATACSAHGLRLDFDTETFCVEITPTLPAKAGNGQFRASQTRYRMAVRRLTPREWERLQGFPDDYTLIPYRGKLAADGPRYRAIGNSMAVPVMRWIGQRIMEVELLCQSTAVQSLNGSH